MRIAALGRTVLLVMMTHGLVRAEGQPPNGPLTPEQYIEQWKGVAVAKMKEHGIPASITLAQGLLESRNGNSELARDGNNHFGIKCTPDWTGGKVYHDDDKKDDCFRKYKRAEDSFEDHSKFLMRPRYAALFELKPTDYKGWAHGLKKAGYATDPRYPEKLISLIERYELHKLDRGVDVSYAKKPSGTGTTTKPSKHGRSKDDGNVVTIGAGREELRSERGMKITLARAGDTYRRIADELELPRGIVAKWNESAPDQQLVEGQVVYLQAKRNKVKDPTTHLVVQGETLWGISQHYGVKASKLAQYNGIGVADKLKPGQTIRLTKPKR
ncbi:MAG: glucosaminidase domain-containing protein [Flavobacteriales bacterium]|nr:glucosaminidase domain-containing protein [Flavobacteriales bacterium]